MFRLTLRSSKNGRFLARVVDPGGYPFVLDFGDSRIIEDLTQRLLHGFTMWRWDKLENVAARSPSLMNRLAEYYAAEGLLVFLEEPTWHGRIHSLEDRLDGPGGPMVPRFLATADPLMSIPEHDAVTEIADFDDPSTEVFALEDVPTEILNLNEMDYDADDFVDLQTESIDLSDAPTEIADRSVLLAMAKAAIKREQSGD